MARPQKFTESEIAAAAQALIAEGEEINPMRVRMRLGGGNVNRIKAVIATLPVRPAAGTLLADRLPEALRRELQHLTSEASQEILSVLTKYWANTTAGSTGPIVEENARLRRRVEELEATALGLSEKIVLAESQRNETDQALNKLALERADLARNHSNLQSALRNAESDFRAAQRTIDSFERNRREDREQIRDLQRRIEDLIAEMAVLKTKASTAPQGERPRSRSSSKARAGGT